MRPERWQLINQLFHSALARPPDKREAFLAEACDGDESLRHAVQSLVVHHEQAESFIESPAYEVAAELLTEDTPDETLPDQSRGQAAIGTRLQDRYEILGLLGAGGMGEVYLAQDTKLGRKVALKLLPAGLSDERDRLRRFEQEARAASALNHPNILTIYEIGQEGSLHFIATEFVEGETLRQGIGRAPLKLVEAIDIALQVASALAVAHDGGIVHRDIKPENIMLRRDHLVKVLDFGLAKLTETMTQPRAADSQTSMTDPGMRVGTVRYMSPEQMRGLPVDARTDLWSLGIVLHEMVTGRTPFEGQTAYDTIALILESQTPSLNHYPAEIPAEFQRIVKKAVSKERERRYQTAVELAADLHRLRRRVGKEANSELPLRPVLSDGRSKPARAVSPAGALIEKVKSQTALSASAIASGVKQHKTATTLAVAITILAIASIAFRPQRLFTWPQAAPPARPLTMVPLTNSGKAIRAAISPDGKYVAHAEEQDGRQRLLITRTATAGVSVIVPPDDVKYLGLTFSHDGDYLYYVRTEKPDFDLGRLYQVTTPGGASRKVMDGVDSPISFSPGGDHFAFVRVNRSEGEYALMVAGIDGTGGRTLAARRDGDSISIDGPAWSPDGRTIVCAAGRWESGYHMNLIEVDVAGGRERPFGARDWFVILQIAWLNDQSGLIISASEQPTSPFQLWKVSYPPGEAVRITNDTSEYTSVSLSRDANLLAALQSRQVKQIWVAPDGDARRARAIASKVGPSYGLNWTGDGRIVFSSMAGSSLHISTINPDGSDHRQLTAGAGDNYNPAASPDGRYIVFTSNRTGTFNIWRMNAADGSEPKQLTFSDGNSYPSCSPDGKWVVYDNQSGGKMTAWKVPIDGGGPVQLTEKYARMPVVSPDGRFIACRYYLESGVVGIGVIPFEGGPPVKSVPIPIRDWQRVQWSPDGRALTYVDTFNGASNIWSYDLDTGQTKQLTDFITERIFSYAWSPDFKQLASERGTEVSDVTLISDYR